jgi:hypothetical protein
MCRPVTSPYAEKRDGIVATGRQRLIGIYIDLAAEYNARGGQRTLHVYAMPNGRLMLRSPNPDSPIRVVLDHITVAEQRAILDALYARDESDPGKVREA